MNHAAILSLIADLYAQISQMQQEIAARDARIAELEKEEKKK